MSFSENLHFLRKRDKITQEELADRLGVTRQSVSKWETGEASPETDKLILLCDLFGVTLDDIVRGDLTATENRADAEEPEAEERQKVGREFVRLTDRFSLRIALGVFLIIFGVAVCVLLSGFERSVGGEITGALCGVAVLLFVAAAVFLFVYSGMEYDRFRKAHPEADSVYDDEARKAFAKKFAAAVSCLVSGILLDAVMLVVFTTLIETDKIMTGNPDAATSFVVSAFLFIIAFIVGGLVFFGLRRAKYYVEEYNRQNNGENAPKHKKIADAVCGTIMLSATAIFLLLGFIWDLWHPGWIVFPVGGILCAIVGTITGTKR